MRLLFRLLVVLIGGWLLLCLLAFLFQRRLQYFPDPRDPPLPRGKPYEELEAVALQAADGTALKAWFWPGTRDLTLLILHGNAGSRGSRLDWASHLHARGWGVFLLDYRGYGGSAGSPSEAGFAQDADAAWDWLVTRGARRIVPLGESIGGGVAVPLAARRPATGLILQSASISIVDVAQRAYPFLPIRWLLRDRFDNRSAASAVTVPALLVHGKDDAIVPLDFGRALHQALGKGATLLEVDGAGHNDLLRVGGKAYLDAVDAYLLTLP